MQHFSKLAGNLLLIGVLFIMLALPMTTIGLLGISQSNNNVLSDTDYRKPKTEDQGQQYETLEVVGETTPSEQMQDSYVSY